MCPGIEPSSQLSASIKHVPQTLCCTYLYSIGLCPRSGNRGNTQPMLPTGVLIVCLKLQAQYLTWLQYSTMTGCNLKEHAKGCGLGQGA